MIDGLDTSNFMRPANISLFLRALLLAGLNLRVVRSASDRYPSLMMFALSISSLVYLGITLLSISSLNEIRKQAKKKVFNV